MTEFFPLQDWADSTRDRNEALYRIRARPLIGDLPVRSVGPAEQDKLYAKLRYCRDLCDGKPVVHDGRDPSGTNTGFGRLASAELAQDNGTLD